MQFVILAYPTISDEDYKMIQDIREAHDMQYTMVEPHFTIVFPTTKLSESEMLKHVDSISLNKKPFNFTLTKAVVEENTFQKRYQIHLEAENVIADIVELHDLLYVDALASELRNNITYTPHVTIASNTDKNIIEKLADEINSRGLNIEGSINEITVCSFDGTKVVDIKKNPLV